MPQRFKLAILAAVRRVRTRWYWAFPFVLWELLKDRFAAWGNETIDDIANPLMKEAVRLLEWAAAQPVFWTAIAVLVIVVAVFLHAYITDRTTANGAQSISSKKLSAKNDGPVYWSLTETLSWIAFGESKSAAQWKAICIADRLPIRPAEEIERFNQAEHVLFEAFRARKLTAQGKKNKSESYEEIPHNYFLSNVACQILHDTIDVNQQAGSEVYRWDGPKWRDVKLEREAVLELWPSRSGPSQEIGSKPRPSKQEISNRSPRKILDFYTGITPLQASRLIEPYMGTWFEADTTVINVLNDTAPGHSYGYFRDLDGVEIECRFTPEWLSNVSRLAPDDPVRIRGELHFTNQTGISLRQCEIVDSPKPAVAPTQRKLTQEQKEVLSENLRKRGWDPDALTLRYFQGCMECLKYAGDLAEALRLAGWNGKNDTTNDANNELTGLHIVVEDLRKKPCDAEFLASALEQANIQFQWSAWEPPLITPAILFIYPNDS